MKQLILLLLISSSAFSQSYTIGDFWKEENTLHWTTTSEKKVDKFLPQYSTDNITWHPMGFVDAHGNSTTTRSYQFNVNPMYDVTFYRLVVRFTNQSEETSIATWNIIRSTQSNPIVNNPTNYQYFDLSGRLCSNGTYLIRRN